MAEAPEVRAVVLNDANKEAVVSMIRRAVTASPAPVALTAEMLGEEDRKHLTWLRGNSTDLELLGVMPCQAAIEANQWADRLLNQGEG